MVQLRRFKTDDAEAQFEAVRESIDDLSKWMPWCHPDHSLEDSEEWIATHPEARERREAFNFAIVARDGALLGSCGVHHCDWLHETAQLGFWVRSACRNRGVATEAVETLCVFAFGELHLHRLEMLVAVENLASRRVAEKAGAHREALLRERLFLNGRRRDANLFVILRSAEPAESGMTRRTDRP